ncbi:polysaccharide lyase family 7 protein [Psychromonas sp. 14N.309.X.WAT.B.A12]|uniref:polysaccharide lyase family 7 protein n=1 Tax=Psychromonas sp. 14N.309.X.WAT.B.A12 TaxID=2998322 RepID=UPI0025B17763|nr:polysaccharide lyase family 7 protein [Psychromonas sp. 14N.309.X.WAT.B.A12]MDN2663485.1 polysaccharide lyase family 7 protein [Psychromonas sp. 14N.309.X.WAT.B.A12]
MKYKLISSAILSVFLSACGGSGSSSSSSEGTDTDSSSSDNSSSTGSYSGVPYDYVQYIHALNNAKLQQNNPPTSSSTSEVVDAGEYNGFDNDYFYLDSTTGWLTFEMTGDSKRSELRFVENFRTNTSEISTLSAEILPISPEESVASSGDGQEMTLMQVHNKGENGETDDTVLSHPLLRIVWDGESRTDDDTGDSYSNAYWAIIKTNAYECKDDSNPNYNDNCPDSYDFYYLADYDQDNATKFDIEAGDSTLIINVDGDEKVNIDITYWDDLYSYFKAGVYNQYEDGTSTVQFKSLTYNGTTLPSADLDSSSAPSDNFELNDWNLSIPTDDDNSGTADTIDEDDLSDGYEDFEYFYTNTDDGGMVFYVEVDGYKTSTNTSYTRTELREMLREGDTSISTKGVNENNWVFSSAPTSEQEKAGGVDGILDATVAVNQVSTTGESYQIGRVIIGQIHANDDEPVRLYYRKLPDNDKGSIYFAHEPRTGDEVWVDMIGSRDNNASNPSDGIALDEPFFYQIKVVGNTLTVTIMRDGKDDVIETWDMTDSGYDETGQYMYFKAGAYNQNNSGEDDEAAQATFYYLNNRH